MAKKNVKKVNPKDVAKREVMEIVSKALTEAGWDVNSGDDYGFTKGTIVVAHPTCDVQIKPITPKANVDRYEVDEDEGE